MDFAKLVLDTRSVRRFKQEPVPGRELLESWVDIARQTPSAANRQPLRYLVVSGAEDCARLFPSLYWAAALKDWPGPAEDERPTGYVLVLRDQRLAKTREHDEGIVAYALQLAARADGFGSCMLGAIERKQIREEFGLPEWCEISLVLAFGAQGESIVLEDAETGVASPSYYRDAQSVHHVPKRRLKDVLID
ncbi:MAG: nitroreductase family protein [Bacillota bacterium]|nr:nitroreductase family protein [Bacillota bacterium]